MQANLQRISLSETPQIWVVQLPHIRQHRSTLNTLLSAEELQRCLRYQHLDDRDRFLGGRVLAKLVASHILNIPVSEITVALESTGKPFLRCVSEDNIHLPFISIAHAGETIVFAINEHTPIGVDVELLRTDVDIDDLMQLAFDAIEIQAVNDFDAHCRLRKFYEFWTLKEAFLKATGEGLLTEPNTIVFHIDAKSHAQLIKASDEKAKSLWNFYFVQFDESYVIAMAAKNYKIDWCEGPKLIDAARLIQAHCR